MTAYGKQWIFWLMRELHRELGVTFTIRCGQRRRLTEADARAITTIVMSREPGHREATVDLLAEHLRIGKTTIKRAMEPYRVRPATIRLASSTERAMPAREPSAERV